MRNEETDSSFLIDSCLLLRLRTPLGCTNLVLHDFVVEMFEVEVGRSADETVDTSCRRRAVDRTGVVNVSSLCSYHWYWRVWTVHQFGSRYVGNLDLQLVSTGRERYIAVGSECTERVLRCAEAIGSEYITTRL